MRLVITQNITLDGVIEQEAGDWFAPAGEEEVDLSDLGEHLQEMMGQEDAQLYGRKTFESMRGFWPHQSDDTTGVTAHLNSVHKYVISTTMEDPEWENSTLISGDLHDEVRALKDQPGGNLGVTGSISVCDSLIGTGLVDAYRLLVYPVVVGRGRRLFGGGDTAQQDLRLTDTKPFTSGIVLLTYEPA